LKRIRKSAALGGVIMIPRLAVILFLTVSAISIVSAQSQPKQLTKEEEQKKREELRKKIKETLDGAVSDVALLKSFENKTFFQVRIACLLWDYDEKGARLLIEDAQALAARMVNDPKINPRGGDYDTWGKRIQIREEIVSMIAERDPQAALEFLRQTKFVIPQDGAQSGRAGLASRSDASLEQKLALQVAKTDPKRALEIAEESLKKGISDELSELVRVVFEKDKEAGKKLAGAILSNLKSADLIGNPNYIEVALRLLESEYAARRAESGTGESTPGAKKRGPVLDDQALREWNNLVIQAALAIMIKEDQSANNRLHLFDDYFSILIRMLPDVEKLSPSLVANIRRQYGQLLPGMKPRDKILLETANAKAEDILAMTMKSPGDQRSEYLWRALVTAVDSEQNFELGRKITEDHITDPDERIAIMVGIDKREKEYALDHGKIEDAAASLMSLESDAERAAMLADLSGKALKSGDKKLAADLLEKALGFLPQPVETKDEYEAMIRIIHNSIGVDRERSFEMFGALIDPINQLVTATIQFKRYNGKRSDPLKDEIPPYELREDFLAKGFVEVIGPLSKADFYRAIDLADRIRQPELKLHMKLLAIQAATSE
jgi:hypothetical protein